MELYFIRHGQSINNAFWGIKEYQNLPDPGLTEIGQAQADQLADFFKDNQLKDGDVEGDNQNTIGFGFTHLYTSLMVRAVSTAVPIAHNLNISLNSWPEIHEAGGIYSRIDGDGKKGLPGQTRSYFQENHPELELPDWLDENGWWNRPFEAREARKPRAENFWTELLARHGDKPGRSEHRVAIVSHGGFYNYLLTSALGVEFPILDSRRHRFWFQMNNCAISRIDYDQVQVSVCYHNRHEYLPDTMIT